MCIKHNRINFFLVDLTKVHFLLKESDYKRCRVLS